MNVPVRRLWRGGMLLGVALGALGCARGGGDGLIVASPWPETERAAMEADFRSWADANPKASREKISIRWVPLARGDDLARVVDRRSGVDVMLGGHASAYARMAHAGKLAAIEPAGGLPWRVVRRFPIELTTASGAGVGVDSGSPAPRGRGMTFDDPRHDPLALAWAKGELGSPGWAEGYARLVQGAGHSRRIGRGSGAALSAVGRGEATTTPAIASGGEAHPEWVEGVAVARECRHRELAETFLKFLAERGQAALPPDEAPVGPEADALLADLLGATLVDAQDELRDAWEVLERAGRPPRAERWMTQAPPWPPASVEEILRLDPSSALPETLAAQIAPDADVRAWLVQSWLRPTRLIDGAWLEELAGGAGGRLVREPRFRAWLQAEWRAWARQRYRRVARLAESVDQFGHDPSPSESSAIPSRTSSP